MNLPKGIFTKKASLTISAMIFSGSIVLGCVFAFEKYTNKQAQMTSEIIIKAIAPVLVKLDSFQKNQNKINVTIVDKIQTFDTALFKDNRGLRDENFKLWRENLNLKEEKKNVNLSMQ